MCQSLHSIAGNGIDISRHGSLHGLIWEMLVLPVHLYESVQKKIVTFQSWLEMHTTVQVSRWLL